MVAAVSKESSQFIEWEMPVAKGHQYQAIYLKMKNLPVGAVAASDAGADWRTIAGV
jgi:hypothetical protein